MVTCRLGILASAMLIATCIFARAQSGPLDGDPTNNRTAPAERTWESHKFTRSEATSGVADPGPALGRSGIAANTLSGRGSGCTPSSPCAAVSPASSGGPLRVARLAHPSCARATVKPAGSGVPVIRSHSGCLASKASITALNGN
jgi:hypothetical protein